MHHHGGRQTTNRRQTVPRAGESSTGRSQRRHPPLSSSASDPITESSPGIAAADVPLRHRAQSKEVSALPHCTSARALRTTLDDVTTDNVAIESSHLNATQTHSVSVQVLADDDASRARPPPQHKGTSRRRKQMKSRNHVESAGTGATRSGHDHHRRSAGRDGGHQNRLQLQKALDLVGRLEDLVRTQNADADRASWRQRPNHGHSSDRPIPARSTPSKGHRRRIPRPRPSSSTAPTTPGDQTGDNFFDTFSEPPELKSRSCSVDQGKPSTQHYTHRNGPPHDSAPTATGSKRRSSRKFLRSLIDKRDAQIRQLQARSRQGVTVATQTEPSYDGYVKDAQCQTQVVDLSHRVAECMNCGSRTSPLDSDRFLRAFGWVDHTAADPQQGYTVAQLQEEFGDRWQDLSILSHATGISIRWFKENWYRGDFYWCLLGSTIRKALGKARHPDIDDQERREYGMSLARARGLYGPTQISDVVVRDEPIDTLPSMFGIGRIVRDRLTGIFYRVLDEYTEPMELGGSSMCTVRREFDYDHSGLLCIRSKTLELVTGEMISAQWHLNYVAERERGQAIAGAIHRANICTLSCPKQLDEWLRLQGWYTMDTLPKLIGQPVHVWNSTTRTFSPVMFVANCEPDQRIVDEDLRKCELLYERSLHGRLHLSRRHWRLGDDCRSTAFTRESLTRKQHPSLRSCTFRNSDGTTYRDEHGRILTVPFCQVYVQYHEEHAATDTHVFHFKRPVFYERRSGVDVCESVHIVDVANWSPTSKLLNDGAPKVYTPKVYTPPESFPDVTRATVDAILSLTGDDTVARDHISGLYGGVILYYPDDSVEIMFLDETRCRRSAGEYTILKPRDLRLSSTEP